MPGKTGRLTAAGKRDNRHTVNLSDAEEELWQEAFAATGRKEFGAWIRAAVNDALGQPGLGEVPMVPEVNHAVFVQLAAIGNNLNQIAFQANTAGGVPAELHARLAAAIEAVGDAALVVRGLRPFGDGDQDDEDQDVADDEAWIDPDGGPA
ncbi:MobC family plasmid mobilization relaxosome protein [Streptomyces sp. SP17BM10]|uniref:MobC family plasmid mobilization relaxosome protein n=1 Tax=Streptomyces sp. SP17BM10 TaxID=3002530 RepID=UPI002E77963A|nr:MobC family plasmid mobilization relaxosome protein [Streptomyces sp. SP17BM10]MEE1784170.1 MobC family plasmid mobilization relaxosome protein [Streptomyces sp. SP17BM10]